MIYIELFITTNSCLDHSGTPLPHTYTMRHLSPKQAEGARKWACEHARLVLQYKILSLLSGGLAKYRLEKVAMRLRLSAPLRKMGTSIFATNSIIAAEAREVLIKHSHLKISMYREFHPELYPGAYEEAAETRLPWIRNLASKFCPTINLDHKVDQLKLDVAHRDAHRDIILYAPNLTVEVDRDTIPALAILLRQRYELGTPCHGNQLNFHVFLRYDARTPRRVRNFESWAATYTRPLFDAIGCPGRVTSIEQHLWF